jgi:hypothetical protein
VAVFLFGALPLLRRRGIGRLLIGDEYDTTRRAVHRGIPHYDGLYDQSRYFDYALTRYYRQKGWGVMQFSLLRPLSEMLGQQILALRYPKLQAEQVSCHATHLVGERAYPCGRCEKCRRVVGMLSAVGADPRRCGYTEEQIGECLAALGSVSLHQEALGAEQIAHLLIERGVLPQPPGKPPREHPEIMKLRFDRERARLEDIPPDLRVPFLRICLEHAAGALRRSGSRWVAFDPLAEAES